MGQAEPRPTVQTGKCMKDPLGLILGWDRPTGSCNLRSQPATQHHYGKQKYFFQMQAKPRIIYQIADCTKTTEPSSCRGNK